MNNQSSVSVVKVENKIKFDLVGYYLDSKNDEAFNSGFSQTNELHFQYMRDRNKWVHTNLFTYKDQFTVIPNAEFGLNTVEDMLVEGKHICRITNKLVGEIYDRGASVPKLNRVVIGFTKIAGDHIRNRIMEACRNKQLFLGFVKYSYSDLDEKDVVYLNDLLMVNMTCEVDIPREYTTQQYIPVLVISNNYKDILK